MKRLLLILYMAFMSSLAGNMTPGKVLYIASYEPIQPYEQLWRAVCQVETKNNPLAYNRKEQAVGIAQIRPIRLKDYNERTRSHLKITEMYDPKKSKTVFLFYAERCKYFDLERIAKSWNGRGKKTNKYWKEVKKHL